MPRLRSSSNVDPLLTRCAATAVGKSGLADHLGTCQLVDRLKIDSFSLILAASPVISTQVAVMTDRRWDNQLANKFASSGAFHMEDYHGQPFKPRNRQLSAGCITLKSQYTIFADGKISQRCHVFQTLHDSIVFLSS